MGSIRLGEIAGFRRSGLWAGVCIAAALVGAHVGCASGGRDPGGRRDLSTPRHRSLEDVLAAFDGYCDGIDSFQAEGSLELRNTRTGRVSRVSFRVLAAPGGRLRLELDGESGPRVVSDGERYELRVTGEATRRGSADDPLPSGGELPTGALRPVDFSRALAPAPLAGAGAVYLSGDASRVTLSVPRDAGGTAPLSRQVDLDRETLRPARDVLYDPSGELASEVSWRWRGDRLVEVVIARPLQGTLARARLDVARRNAPVPPAAFAVSAEVVGS